MSDQDQNQGAYQAPSSGTYQAPQSGSYQAPQSGSYQAPTQGTYQAQPQGAYQAPVGGYQPTAYAAPAGGDKKGGKGLIIGLIAGIAVLVLALILAVGVFDVLGLRDKGNDKKTEDVKEKKPKKNKDIAADDEYEDDDEEEENSAPVPFCEENGLKFSNPFDGFSNPMFIAQMDDNDKVVETDDRFSVLRGADAEFEFNDIAVTEPDENGYVTYKIVYTESNDTTVKITDYSNFFKDYDFSVTSTWPRKFALYDYYTGDQISLPKQNNMMFEDSTQEEATTTIVWDGETYDITTTFDAEPIETSDDSWTVEPAAEEEGANLYSISYITKYEVRVKCPEDYDGLVLMNTLSGYTRDYFEAYDTHVESEGLAGKDDHGIAYEKDDLYLVRVNDYISRHDKNDWLTENGVIISTSGDDTYFYTGESKDGAHVDNIWVPAVVYTGETTDGCPSGYKIVYADINYNTRNLKKNHYLNLWFEAFDRYNGISFESGTEFTSGHLGNSENVDTIMVPVDGEEYDINISYTYEENGGDDRTCKIEVLCPEDYDGTVFRIGYGDINLFNEFTGISDISTRQYSLDELPYFDNGHCYYYYTVNGY